MVVNLTVTINKVTITNQTTPEINQGEYNVNTCNFNFSQEFEGLEKRAVFSNVLGQKYLVEIKNNICIIPEEILGLVGTLTIGVYGFINNENELQLRYSPTPATLPINEGSYISNAPVPIPPKMINDLYKQVTDFITAVQAMLDSGDFNGVGIQNIIFNPNYTMTIILTNGSTITSPSLRGEKGDTGEPGQNGTDGIDGQDGTDGKSAYQIWLDEGNVGTEQDFLDSLRGKDGKDGKDGQDGYTPQKGIDYFTSEDIASLNIPAKTSQLQNDSGFLTNLTNNLVNYTLKTNTGSLIDLEINQTTYVVTLKLKDVDGNIISTDTIDLPLENVVVSGRYDNNTKKVILTLENGSEVDFSIADLVAGLQTEITSQNKLASDLVDDTNSGNKFVTSSEKQTWNNKLDSSDLTNYITNTDYVESGKAGIIKLSSGLGASNGYIYLTVYSYENYNNATNGLFIGKGTLENVITGKNLETGNNKVTTISSSSTNTEYPSAKAVYDYIQSLDGDEVSY